MTIILSFVIIGILCQKVNASIKTSTKDLWLDVADISNLLRDILKTTSQNTACSVILITEAKDEFLLSSVAKDLHGKDSTGYVLFVVSIAKGNSSVSDEQVANLSSLAQKVRKQSSCIVVVLFSQSYNFLVSFDEISIASRLLRGTMTKLVVVTKLNPPEMSHVLSDYWTYSVMNTLLINLKSPTVKRWELYTHHPYTKEGRKNILIGSYDQMNGKLRIFKHQHLYPDKFSNFHGTTVNVTSLNYPPRFIVEELSNEDGSVRKKIHGTDGLLLEAVAQSLNFTFHVLPATTWEEVGDLVATRKAYVSPVIWTVLPKRLEKFDMTYTYDISPLSFCMAKPGLKPQWQSLYYPLNNVVWAASLGFLIVTPGILFMINGHPKSREFTVNNSLSKSVMDIYGTLLGQNLSRISLHSNSGQILMATWLFFALVLSSAYKSNLTAHLTFPKYPPRPETPEELVQQIDILVSESYGSSFKEFFVKSGNEVYEKLGNMMVTGKPTVEGLTEALKNRRKAVFGGKDFIENIIIDKFTRIDRSTDLYIGRARLLSGRSAWPMPHDAPFKTNFDQSMQAALGAGLLEKWDSDTKRDLLLKSIREQKERQLTENLEDEGIASTEGRQGTPMKLSLVEMQGPLFLLSLGLLFACVVFAIERIQSLL